MTLFPGQVFNPGQVFHAKVAMGTAPASRGKAAFGPVLGQPWVYHGWFEGLRPPAPTLGAAFGSVARVPLGESPFTLASAKVELGKVAPASQLPAARVLTAALEPLASPPPVKPWPAKAPPPAFLARQSQILVKQVAEARDEARVAAANAVDMARISAIGRGQLNPPYVLGQVAQ